jgi:hypothetical protein
MLVTRQNIILQKANFIYRMNRTTCQSLKFVNLTSEQILIHETHIVYETYILMNIYCIFLAKGICILYIALYTYIVYRDGESGNGNPYTKSACQRKITLLRKSYSIIWVMLQKGVDDVSEDDDE